MRNRLLRQPRESGADAARLGRKLECSCTAPHDDPAFVPMSLDRAQRPRPENKAGYILFKLIQAFTSRFLLLERATLRLVPVDCMTYQCSHILEPQLGLQVAAMDVHRLATEAELRGNFTGVPPLPD